jgi:hypothetical protein
MSQLDYAHDSLAEITLKQREIVEQQGYRILFLTSENMALREDADSVIARDHQRLTDALGLLENWVHARVQEGHTSCDAEALLATLWDCIEYCEEGVVPTGFEAARAEAERSL